MFRVLYSVSAGCHLPTGNRSICPYKGRFSLSASILRKKTYQKSFAIR
jgi:hypothetical protein